MPARRTFTPKYRHYRPKDLAVVRIDGQDHYLGKYDSPESREKYHRLLAERAAGRAPADTPTSEKPSRAEPTVAEVILAFWEHAERHYRAPDGTPSEELGNFKGALRPLRKLYGTTLARDFGPLSLQAVREDMVRSGLARTTVNSRVNRIRRAFRWAVSVELVPESVADALSRVAGLQRGRTEARETEPIGPVEVEVIDATLPHLTRPVAGLVRLLLLTGMRPGEACIMRGRDLKAGEPNWTYAPASHKTRHRGKSRVIALGPRAVELVKSFLTTDLDAYLFRPSDAVAERHAQRSASRASKPTPSEIARRKASPGSKHSARYRRHTLRNAIHLACDKAFPHPTIRKRRGKPLSPVESAELLAWRKAHRWNANQIRHTAATEIRAKFGIEAAQAVLGHSKPDTTVIYAERDLGRANEVMREIG